MMSASGTRQTPIPFAEKPARRWKRIAATRRRILRSTMPSRWARNSVGRHPDLGGGGVVGTLDGLHRALERPDHGDVGVVVGLGLELARGHGLGDGGRQRLGVALHLEVHVDLEELERRQLADRLGPGHLLQGGERPLQAELGVGRRRDREPEVELVGPQVVVRDAGVRVDDLRRALGVLGVDLGGDQHRAVAEGAGVEDRGDLADDPAVEQALGALEDLVQGQCSI